ncbi:MAG: hypothetical protein IJY96_06860 [Oscillospiraceae bacterium]|nr:hypothetical protein [Oscillospiraceae bacterium]
MPDICAFAADGTAITEKSGNLSPVYGFIALFSMVLVVVYLLWEKKREKRFVLLFCCVAVANCGYFMLSVSGSLSGALWANRVSYFGCAFAVLMMLLIVIEVCQVQMSKLAMGILIGVSAAAFALAATGGWLNIYYSSVHIEDINGMTVLVKSYAPLHILYTAYILTYFVLMTVVIVSSKKQGRLSSTKYAVFLAAIVLGNIAVWGVEQLISIDFEFLSISYVATEVFLLLMRLVMHDYDALRNSKQKTEPIIITVPAAAEENASELPPDMEALFTTFSERVTTLTASERMILQYHIDGYSLEEAAAELYISVNTARKHNSNLRRKLELGSKEELSLYIDLFRRAGRLDEITYMR